MVAPMAGSSAMMFAAAHRSGGATCPSRGRPSGPRTILAMPSAATKPTPVPRIGRVEVAGLVTDVADGVHGAGGREAAADHVAGEPGRRSTPRGSMCAAAVDALGDEPADHESADAGVAAHDDLSGDPRRFEPGPFTSCRLRAQRGRAGARQIAIAMRETRAARGSRGTLSVRSGGGQASSARVRISSQAGVKSSTETTSCFFPAPRARTATFPAPPRASRAPPCTGPSDLAVADPVVEGVAAVIADVHGSRPRAAWPSPAGPTPRARRRSGARAPARARARPGRRRRSAR